MDDLLIRGALMIDARGRPGREADVLVAGERIVAVVFAQGEPVLLELGLDEELD